MNTIKLINRNDSAVNVRLQSLIREAVANIGDIDEVILGEVFEDESSNENILPIYYESTDNNGDIIEEFLFNINLSDYTIE